MEESLVHPILLRFTRSPTQSHRAEFQAENTLPPHFNLQVNDEIERLFAAQNWQEIINQSSAASQEIEANIGNTIALPLLPFTKLAKPTLRQLSIARAMSSLEFVRDYFILAPVLLIRKKQLFIIG